MVDEDLLDLLIAHIDLHAEHGLFWLISLPYTY